MIVLSVYSLNAQPVEVPLRTNPQIYQPANSTSREDDPMKIRIYVPQGGSTTYCPDSRLITGLIDSVSFQECQDLSFGTVSFSDSCITYTSDGSLGQDVICVDICDIEDVCTPFELIFITSL